MFPTWSEVLEVLKALGYQKPPGAPPSAAGPAYQGARAAL
jgi:hypothetical protein